MEEKKVRNRGSNYSESEKYLLLQIIEEYKNIIDNKQTNGAMWKEKESAWEKVTRKFNASSGRAERTASSLKACYENLKKMARKAISNKKIEISNTDGSLTKGKFSQLLEHAITMTPKTVYPLPARFDSDSGYNTFIVNAKEGESEMASTSASANGVVVLTLDGGDMFSTKEEIDSVHLEVVNDSKDTRRLLDWSDCSSIKVLQTSALPMTDECCATVSSVRPVPQGSTPLQHPGMHGCNYCTKMSRTPAHPARQRRATYPHISPVPIVHSAASPQGQSLPPASGETSSPSCDSLRRPSIQKPPNLDVTSAFEDLASAKQQLVSLQMELLRNEEERKKKLYEAEEMQNNLKIQILKTELEIKKNILKQEVAKIEKTVQF